MSIKSDRIIEVLPEKEQIISGKKNVQCTIKGCCRMFPHEGMLRMHLVKSHGQIKTENDRRLFSKIQKKASDITYIFFCPEADCKYSSGAKHFTTFHLLKQHYMKMHAEKKYFCKKCERGFSEQRFLRQHEDQCGNLYTCETCPVFYTTREALQTHCKRHDHIYPEVYRRKDKEKEEKQRNKKKKGTNDGGNMLLNRVPGIPVLLLTVKPEPAPAPPKILPKPVTVPKQPVSVSTRLVTHETKPGQTVHESHKEISNRQEVMIQTDIYGVHSLSVSGKNQNMHKVDSRADILSRGCDTFIQGQTSVMVSPNNESQYNPGLISPSSPKGRQKTLKRRSNYPRPSSPRRKRAKTTTGIQTSVSLTQKKSNRIVGSTQTTGDFILKKAMAEADIPIEKRTIGSQVTPQKSNAGYGNAGVGSNGLCTGSNRFIRRPMPILKDSFSQVTHPLLVDSCSQVNPIVKPHLVDSYSQVNENIKPLLVDSFSQVRQRNILAETSVNMAESQTMTERPESISTQTSQSFLGKKQDRASQPGIPQSVFPSNKTVLTQKQNFDGSVDSMPKYDTGTYSEKKKKGTLVEIYNDRLEKAVTIHVPIEERASHEQPTVRLDPRKAYLNKLKLQNNITAKNISIEREDFNTDRSAYHGLRINDINENVSSSHDSIFPRSYASSITLQTNVPSSTVNSISTHTGVETDMMTGHTGGSTADTEVQAMSAQDFQLLLQSSGINIETACLGANLATNGNNTILLGNNDKTFDSNFDFLNSDTDTIDMNTQTVSDFDLFDSIGAIDMNTQTTGNDVDFLADLVTYNMETQTLNDEDLASLRLTSIGSNTVGLNTEFHSLGVGTNDMVKMSKATSPRAQVDDAIDYSLPFEYETVTHSLGIGTSDFEFESNFSSNDITCMPSNPELAKVYNKHDDFINTQTGLQLLGNFTGRKTAQTETQTTGCEAGDQLVQTEMQTQVDSGDINFEMTNMETQTTFDEFCDWLL